MKPMKRREVADALLAHECLIDREGSEHTVWRCPCGKHTAPVPRHVEISPGTVRDIQRRMECLEKRWLQ